MPYEPQAVFIFAHHSPNVKDDEFAVVFPTTSKAFREEIALLEGAVREHPFKSTDDLWEFPLQHLQRLIEAIEDFYPRWTLDPQCSRCRIVTADVRFRRDPYSDSGSGAVLCDDCHEVSIYTTTRKDFDA